MPRKSRTRGKAIVIRRSRKSHIFSPCKVTLAPMARPSRILKFEIAFLERVGTAFWPVMAPRVVTTSSMRRWLPVASPTPIFRTIFSRRGNSMTFFSPSSFWRAGTISFRYLSLSLFIFSSRLVYRLAGLLFHADALAVLDGLPHLHGLVALVHQHHIGDVHRQFLLDDPALVVRAAATGLLMLLGLVHAFDDHGLVLGDDGDDAPGLSLGLARDHLHVVL